MEEVIDQRWKCDFCGKNTDEVKRIALDVDYNRVLAKALYACLDCSDKKEHKRVWNDK
jgi:ribosomal protein L37AE/L43A